MTLKIFQRVNNYRLVVNVDELLWDVLTSALTFPRRENQSNRTHLKFSPLKTYPSKRGFLFNLVYYNMIANTRQAEKVGYVQQEIL